MLGILFGTACLIGLVKTLRGHGCCGPRWGGGCCGPEGGHGHGGHCGGHHHGHHGGPGRWMLRRMFERLDTTPGQEKVIVAAFEQVRAKAFEHREELARSRADLAKAMRGEALDLATLDALFARHDAALAELRRVATEALGKVHEALDERQRRELADLLDQGGFFFHRPFGPYRSM